MMLLETIIFTFTFYLFILIKHKKTQFEFMEILILRFYLTQYFHLLGVLGFWGFGVLGF